MFEFKFFYSMGFLYVLESIHNAYTTQWLSEDIFQFAIWIYNANGNVSW